MRNRTLRLCTPKPQSRQPSDIPLQPNQSEPVVVNINGVHYWDLPDIIEKYFSLISFTSKFFTNEDLFQFFQHYVDILTIIGVI